MSLLLLSFVLLTTGIRGTANIAWCDDCRRSPIVVTFVDSCDESCASDVLESADATYANTVFNYSVSNTAVLQTVPEDDSWDLIVESGNVTSVECNHCLFSDNVEPVCGSDNVTYWSPEHLECAANWCPPEAGEQPVTVVKEGACKAELECENCPTRKLPITVSFTESCDETCIKSILDSVNAVDYDIMATVPKAVLRTDLSDESWDILLETEYVMWAKCQDECLQITTGIEDFDNNPLCGSDGHTYANQMELDCAVGNFCPGEEPVTVAKYGACDTSDDSSDASILTAATLFLVLTNFWLF